MDSFAPIELIPTTGFDAAPVCARSDSDESLVFDMPVDAEHSSGSDTRAYCVIA
jgi:hypothetical protein